MTTKNEIRVLLHNNLHAIERGIVAIYRRQTNDEQQQSTTKHDNGRGFTAADAKMGTYLAKWILSGRRLSGEWRFKARDLIKKYAGQLVEVAAQKTAMRSHSNGQ